MFYTGYENHRDSELLAMAMLSKNPLTLELAKRLSRQREGCANYTLADDDIEVAALRGVNPIPLNVGEEA